MQDGKDASLLSPLVPVHFTPSQKIEHVQIRLPYKLHTHHHMPGARQMWHQEVLREEYPKPYGV